MIKKAFISDRNTTFAGLAIILMAVGTAMTAIFDGNPETVADWNILVAEFMAAIGLMLAGDGGKE